MSVLNMKTWFLLCFTFIYSQTEKSQPYLSPNYYFVNSFPREAKTKIDNLRQIFGNESSNKRNVVLFLAHTTSSYVSQPEVLQCLKLEEKAMIKMVKETNQLEMQKRHIRFTMFRKRNTKTCAELFKLSILSLINYCRLALGMTTAIASIANETLYNVIKVKSDLEPGIIREQDNDVFGIPRQGENLPHENKDDQKDDKTNPKTLPSYSVFGYNRFGKPIRNVITDGEQSESFNVRIKRGCLDGRCQDNPPEDASREELTTELAEAGKDNGSFWGIMNIVTDTKFSFFGKLFGDSNNQTKDEELDLDNLGQIKDSSFFEVVKSTLTRLQNKESPFLMIVIGGETSDLSKKNSQLVQSIKHVMENEVNNNTLFVVTGMCPECQTSVNGEERVVNIGGSQTSTPGRYESGDNEVILPILSRGNDYNMLSQCSDLYDVPLIIKTILRRSCKEGSQQQIRKRRDTTDDQSSANVATASVGTLIFCIIVYFFQ